MDSIREQVISALIREFPPEREKLLYFGVDQAFRYVSLQRTGPVYSMMFHDHADTAISFIKQHDFVSSAMLDLDAASLDTVYLAVTKNDSVEAPRPLQALLDSIELDPSQVEQALMQEYGERFVAHLHNDEVFPDPLLGPSAQDT